MTDQMTAVSGRFEQMERDLAELRAERAADRAELEAFRAQVVSQHANPEPDAALGQSAQSARRRLGRRRPAGSGEGEPSGLMSRRRLFGLLGGAAAVGTGLAVAGSALTADPAGAADGSNVVIGQSNSNTTGSTVLTGSTKAGNGAMLEVDQSDGPDAIFGFNTSGGTDAVGIKAQVSGNGTNNVGVDGSATGSGTGSVGVLGAASGPSGFGVIGIASGTGGIGVWAISTTNAQLVLVDNGVAVPGTSQVWNTGSFVVSGGILWFCSAGGTGSAAVFERLSPLVTLASPVRVYDSRVGFLPSTGPKSPITTGATVTLDVTNNSSGVPDTASAVLGNITVTNSGNGFLTVYNAALGSSVPATSSINLVPGVTLANNFTSACDPNHNIKVTCGGPGPTDFIVDIFGYYP